MLTLALALAAAPAPAPFVELTTLRGEVDGPHRGALAAPHWDRLELDLRIQNRLAVRTGDFRLEVELLRGDAPIPGWTFEVRLEEAWLEPRSSLQLPVGRPLPDRREALDAARITYRVSTESYRVDPPSLAVALDLLASPYAWDQRAALQSFEQLPERQRLNQIDEIRGIVDALPAAPVAQDALRLLFALRVAGDLEATMLVPRLLELETKVAVDAWGQAVLQLADRLTAHSGRDEPRLEILPEWAREPSALLRVRAADAVREAVVDAVIRMGDAAVPTLMRLLHRGDDDATRERAWRLLVELGRATVRAQLGVEDERVRLEVIRTLGELELADSAPSLVQVLQGPDPTLSRAARRALKALGPIGESALWDALGTPGDSRVREALMAGGATREAVFEARAAAAEAHRRQLRAEVERALGLTEPGAALSALDALEAAGQRPHEIEADAIRRLYLSHAEGLLAGGDPERALEVAERGLARVGGDGLRAIAQQARLALTEGWADLGRWERVQALLQDGGPSFQPMAQRVRARMAVSLSESALAAGDRALARKLVDSALAEGLVHERLNSLQLRLTIAENLPFIAGAALGLLALGLSIVVWLRRRVLRRRMARLEAELDQAPT